jgi:hypothetical protein
MDEKQEEVIQLMTEVNRYFGVKISGKGYKVLLARQCYFKYGLEVGINGHRLEAPLNRPKNCAINSRKYFTNSFKTNPQNKQAYHNFKNYIESK